METFQLLVDHAQTLPGFWVEPKMHGQIRTLVYNDMGGNKQPFSVIINRNSLLFYLRKPGIAPLVDGADGLQSTFPQSKENPSGEYTVRLISSADATGLLHYLFDLLPIQQSSETAVNTISVDSQEKLAALRCSSAYAKAVEAYSNKFVNGAGMQKPGTRGFELWLIFSTHTKQTENPPTLRKAIELAKEYGLNTTSAANALAKWSAYYGFRPARTGEYAVGPRS